MERDRLSTLPMNRRGMRIKNAPEIALRGVFVQAG
jgi:hypothetical protein